MFRLTTGHSMKPFTARTLRPTSLGRSPTSAYSTTNRCVLPQTGAYYHKQVCVVPQTPHQCIYCHKKVRTITNKCVLPQTSSGYIQCSKYCTLNYYIYCMYMVASSNFKTFYRKKEEILFY